MAAWSGLAGVQAHRELTGDPQVAFPVHLSSAKDRDLELLHRIQHGSGNARVFRFLTAWVPGCLRA
jgi:hypothetical protein